MACPAMLKTAMLKTQRCVQYLLTLATLLRRSQSLHNHLPSRSKPLQYVDADLKIFVRSQQGTIVSKTIGEHGFAIATFAGEAPFETELPNLPVASQEVQPVMKRPASSKKAKASACKRLAANALQKEAQTLLTLLRQARCLGEARVLCNMRKPPDMVWQLLASGGLAFLCINVFASIAKAVGKHVSSPSLICLPAVHQRFLRNSQG